MKLRKKHTKIIQCITIKYENKVDNVSTALSNTTTCILEQNNL